MNESLNIEEIQKYLPHRYPFLLVDRVLELDLGKYIKACKNVKTNDWKPHLQPEWILGAFSSPGGL